MENTVLVILVVLQSVTLIVLAVAAVLYLRSTSAAMNEVGQAARDIRDSVKPVADDLRRTINDTDDLVLTTKSGVDSIVRLSGSLERIVEISRLAHVAEKALTSSKTSVTSVIDGIKAGLHALRSKSKREEGSDDGE